MTPDDLQKLAQTHQEAQSRFEHTIGVCVAASCLSSRSDQIKTALAEEVKQRGLEGVCQVKGVGCLGLCEAGPLVACRPEGTLYQGVTPEDAGEIVESVGRSPVRRLTCPTDIPFFQRQTRIVLENTGVIDPEHLEEYVSAGGYAGLLAAVTELTPTAILDQIGRSGLRGRGGAGYPTGLKWSTVAKSAGASKVVICNADEGDPGAFMDRSVLESDPHRVLEGMALAGFAVGADRGVIYVRAEYPLAVKRLRRAIQQAERLGLLGNRIGGSPFGFHVEVRLGAGAFVCGEETALIASIEGKRGTPRPRPPYPAEYGLRGLPTLINNVETFANVAPIVRNGGDWFAAIGTEKSAGTKVFALAGRIQHTGVVEVPMGITLREIIFEIGGGIPEGRSFKAVQTGGPSGGCIPAEYLDMPVDYESLKRAGSIMGSGGMIVLDESSCMVDVARYFMDFCRSESCGKCIPCRVGTVEAHELLKQIGSGRASIAEIETLETLCDLMRSTSLCGLGQSAPNPVESSLRFFRDEYLAHVVGPAGHPRCPAGVCQVRSEAEVAV
ncbi:MAG: SLBB domain-containing protein [Chloroflexi bacterium]|nr:SLBB domain-containing protein [Chloroflexota bacterium]